MLVRMTRSLLALVPLLASASGSDADFAWEAMHHVEATTDKIYARAFAEELVKVEKIGDRLEVDDLYVYATKCFKLEPEEIRQKTPECAKKPYVSTCEGKVKFNKCTKGGLHPEICKVTFKTFKTNDDYLVDKVHCRIAFEKEIEKLDSILKKKGIKRRVKREQPEVPDNQETGPGLVTSRSEPEGFPGAGPSRPLLGANGHGI